MLTRVTNLVLRLAPVLVATLALALIIFSVKNMSCANREGPRSTNQERKKPDRGVHNVTTLRWTARFQNSPSKTSSLKETSEVRKKLSLPEIQSDGHVDRDFRRAKYNQTRQQVSIKATRAASVSLEACKPLESCARMRLPITLMSCGPQSLTMPRAITSSATVSGDCSATAPRHCWPAFGPRQFPPQHPCLPRLATLQRTKRE